ncbi:phytoene synthase [Halopolyspora algeriensis]|uniref:Phytoene synthase n=1 Tax=Halopolyspora algeriensis TaxID=1500506 RepID=A0A368VVP3_9ACTN|nr:phytoene/squalene synthase family protein [Halopolyspora algeriensis]RCW46166.1 phytoene synthase [Halopolyspora algeriensis]TQM55569.1 phytoene synthase [Halopolyspora algeriensis]
MTRHELRTAGIREPAVCAAYERCRRLNARHGRTYFLATRMLTPAQRPAVHALYGFARWADDIVDDLDPTRSTQARAEELERLGTALHAGLRHGHSEHPVLAALVDTVTRYGIDHEYFTAFLRSMRQDLTVTDYPTRTALNSYVHGSADVIGLQVLPVLGTVTGHEHAAPRAAALGNAFQLTNFLRDLGEDLQRGRVYLPADELAAFGVDRDRLLWCLRAGRPDRRVRHALADQVARTRAIYRYAQPGINMLAPVSRPCVATAFTLYGEILDQLVDADYNVFDTRVSVPATRRLGVAGTAVFGALTTRARARLAGQRHAGTAPTAANSPDVR